MKIPRFSRFSFLFGILIFIFGIPLLLADENNPTITLERPIYFPAPDGSDVLVPPGTYTVEKAEEWLRLIPGERHNAFLLEAESFSHEENLEKPLAVLVPGDEGKSPDRQIMYCSYQAGKALQPLAH